jgi:hypothetical protein
MELVTASFELSNESPGLINDTNLLTGCMTISFSSSTLFSELLLIMQVIVLKRSVIYYAGSEILNKIFAVLRKVVCKA